MTSNDSVLDNHKPWQDIAKSVTFRPGLPVKAMLAKPTNGISEVLDKYQEQPFTVEYKYDGERAQVQSCSRVYMMHATGMMGSVLRCISTSYMCILRWTQV